jgi:hypothetical protein
VKLKHGVIYIIKTKAGEIFEAEYRAGVRDVHVFSSLPFQKSVQLPRRFFREDEIDWAEPVCPMTNETTGASYENTLTKLY